MTDPPGERGIVAHARSPFPRGVAEGEHPRPLVGPGLRPALAPAPPGRLRPAAPRCAQCPAAHRRGARAPQQRAVQEAPPPRLRRRGRIDRPPPSPGRGTPDPDPGGGRGAQGRRPGARRPPRPPPEVPDPRVTLVAAVAVIFPR